MAKKGQKSNLWSQGAWGAIHHPGADGLHTHTRRASLIINVTQQDDTFFTKNESTLVHHNHQNRWFILQFILGIVHFI